MKTEDLINALAADVGPEQGVAYGLPWRLAGAFALCVGAVGVGLGFREDLGMAMITPVSALRIVLALTLLGLGMQAVRYLVRPEGTGRLWPLWLVGGAAAGAVIWGLVTTPRADWAAEAMGETALACLVSIPALSVLPVVVLMFALRQGATTRPVLAGAMAGLTGAAGAAAAYALHCPDDNPLFYVSWYGLSIMLVVGVSAIVGGRVLRW